jgi:hypothetical protein
LVLGVTCHKISQIAIANSMWFFSSNPITSTPPRMGSPQSLHSSDGSR